MSFKLLSTLSAGALVLSLAACGGGEGNNTYVYVYGSGGGGTSTGGDTGGSTGGGTGGGTGTTTECPTPSVLVSEGFCQLSGRITEDFTMTSDITWVLKGTVVVGDGNNLRSVVPTPVNATLTIDAGTSIVGTSDGALVISRGSSIMAQGTAAEPIIFSSADDGYDGNGEWGGVVMQGYARNNQCGPEGTNDFDNCDILGEGKDIFYFGGNDDTDSSGVFEYVIIAEGGTEIAPDNEINGLTLMSVGSGTVINYVQVHGNKDDGIEFFGGTVDVNYLVLTENGDESVDWDEGYTGTVDNIYVKQVDGFGDHLIEADNAGPSNTATPISNPTISNAQFVSADLDEGIRLSKGTNATLTNVTVIGLTNDECFDLDSPGSDLVFTNVVFSGCSALDKQGATTISGVTLDASATVSAPEWASSFALEGTL